MNLKRKQKTRTVACKLMVETELLLNQKQLFWLHNLPCNVLFPMHMKLYIAFECHPTFSEVEKGS